MENGLPNCEKSLWRTIQKFLIETLKLAQECQNWPRGRFRRSGGIYNEGRFTSDPILEWSGEYNLPNSAYGQGTWTSSGYQSVQVNNIAGGYKITKR